MTKAKNAQEAHEAIRPTDLARLPAHVSRFLERDEARLYELIWTRTLASQMESADLERTIVDIRADAGARTLHLRANGQVVRFDGFLKLYQEGRDDDEDDESSRLPPMEKGEALAKKSIESSQHFTEPPPRFTEATLIKRMEELGIGRPSTYASTLAVLKDRDYVKLDKKRLVPEDKGRIVTAFLESFFTRYVGYDFTADLEEKLDRISNHEIDWKEVLRDFWRDFSSALDGTKDLRITHVLDSLNELLGPAYLSAEGGRLQSARLPLLRQRHSVAEARQIRRLHRLFELSRLQIHPHADGRRRRRSVGRQSARHRSRERRGSHRPRRPLRRLCAIGRRRGRRKAEAHLDPEDHDAVGTDARRGDRASRSAAGSRASS